MFGGISVESRACFAGTLLLSSLSLSHTNLKPEGFLNPSNAPAPLQYITLTDHSLTSSLVRAFILGYHAAGTCAMGKPDDPLAVVDSQLRVRGVEGLRVADVSIMPKLHGGHTQMPAYGIGEKAADMIKEAWA